MPFLLSDQSDSLIQVYCNLIGYIEENDQLNNMAAGSKMWHKSSDPNQAQRESRKAHDSNLISSDDANNNKRLWSYIKSKRKTNVEYPRKRKITKKLLTALQSYYSE